MARVREEENTYIFGNQHCELILFMCKNNIENIDQKIS
jgi:hypothetical protein